MSVRMTRFARASQQSNEGEERPGAIYIHSEELIDAADLLPSNEGRASRVHELIAALPGLMPRLKVVQPKPASEDDLLRFHSPALVARLLQDEPSTSEEEDEEPPKKRARCEQSEEAEEEEGEELMSSDCPPFHGMPDYIKLVAGASMTGARALRDRETKVAINWTGGRHHAAKNRAAGFCYVQDIVLAIGELRKMASLEPKPRRLDRVLVIDLDVHAGDGVRDAYYSSDRVLTLSMHAQFAGFWPWTCSLDDSGPPPPSSAAYHALNVALPEQGASGKTLERLFASCIVPVYEAFEPDALVLVLGVDCLAGDGVFKETSYSLESYLRVLKACLEWNLPTLMLGGGGYKSTNAARAWAACTAVAVGFDIADILSWQIPEHCYWTEYGDPDHQLAIPPGRRYDYNTEEDLEGIESAFKVYADRLKKRYSS